MTKNGFLVQCSERKARFPFGPRYKGPASRVSWPLDAMSDAESKRLTERSKDWFYRAYLDEDSLWVCPEPGFVAEYVRHCMVLNVGVSVYACESRRSSPVVEASGAWQALRRFIGWDFIGVAFDYSAIADELAEPHIPSLEPFARALNPFGLFDTETEMLAYLEERRRLSKLGASLELELNMVACSFYEVDSQALTGS